jgi:5-methyltetrahydrofolate--homocysteine methyltransferase
MTSRDRFQEELQRRILVLDGAMGTMVQAHALSEADYRGDRLARHATELRGNHDILTLTRPEIIREIHRTYLAAGADIVTTNTFNATSISQAEYETQHLVKDMNATAARIAREAVDEFVSKRPGQPRFVAGCLGPTHRSASISPDANDPGGRNVTFDELAAAYAEAAGALLDGGADILLIETVFDTLNAKAALFATMEVLDRRGDDTPLWVSATVGDASGRMLTGQTIEAFWISIRHARPVCAGLNCGLGAEALRPRLQELAAAAATHVSIHPNAGLPDASGRHRETPHQMAAALGEFARSGLVNIVGGCCGTTPEHIAAIAQAVAGATPRRVPESEPWCRLSGLESLEIRPDSLFINIGERTNVAGSARFRRLVIENRLDEALAVARTQIRHGAQAIDIHLDDPLVDSAARMQRFLNLIASDPEIARVPVMIDSSDWEVIEAGLRCLPGRGIVNSISLKDGEAEFRRRAGRILRLGAAMVVMAIDEQGQAESCARKLSICRRAHRILTQAAGVPPEDIILDPNVLPIGTGMPEHADHAVAFLDACRAIKEELPHSLVSGGVSNLSYAFRGNDTVRAALHAVFLYHAIQAGMDMGIVNAGQLPGYEDVPRELRDAAEDLILNRRPDATPRLVELAVRTKPHPGRSTPDAAWRHAPVAERIRFALMNGIADHIEQDALEALQELGEPLPVVEGPLMDGMRAVGDLFAEGKLFLPQVIRSARVMQMAVAALQPHVRARPDGPSAAPAGRILMATVRGDVHDIGKRIVSVVLGCNALEVIDLGVRVPAERIVAQATEQRADIIGLSGLITPSLEEMAHVARELERARLRIPLLIGGATTSALHTAVRIDPLYGGAVQHVPDASRAVTAVHALLDPKTAAARTEALKAEYAAIRAQHARARAEEPLLPLAEARRRRLPVAWSAYRPECPQRLGLVAFDDYPLDDLIDTIDWTPFFRAWNLSGRYPEILNAEPAGKEARRLFAEAQHALRVAIAEQTLVARAVSGLFPANACGDDIEVYANEARGIVRAVIHCLRQQRPGKPGEPRLCLSDYVAPKETGVRDYVGAFVATVGDRDRPAVARAVSGGAEYDAIMRRTIADRLVEALAERLHARVRREFWGYAADEQLTGAALLREPYRGIRPAPGYSMCPDHSEKRILFDLLEAEAKIGVALTETFALVPPAAVCGWYLAHPQARGFELGRLARDQVTDYAARKGMAVAEAERWLARHLAYSRER